MNKALRSGSAPSWVGNPIIGTLWGKTVSRYRIIFNVSDSEKSLRIVRFGFCLNLCILFCIMVWGLVFQVGNVGNIRQNEESHHEGKDTEPWPIITLTLCSLMLHGMSLSDAIKKTGGQFLWPAGITDNSESGNGRLARRRVRITKTMAHSINFPRGYSQPNKCGYIVGRTRGTDNGNICNLAISSPSSMPTKARMVVESCWASSLPGWRD